jgi:hypothetical protein
VHVLRIEHEVVDYDRWKAAFDADPLDRRGSGVRHYRVGRSVEDPTFVLIDLEFDSAAEAAAMHEKLRGLWAGPGRDVMVSPGARVVESVESGDL